MSTCTHRHDDGAYVLGALSPEDRAEFEGHLADCPDCSQAVGRLAGLPGLLARVPVEVLLEGRETPPVPDTLLPRLLRRARRARQRRRWLAAGLAAASVVAVVSVGALAVTAMDDGAPAGNPTAARTAPAKPLQVVGAAPITGWVSLTGVPWGTRLDLTCRYGSRASDAYGDASPVVYVLYATHRDGTAERVASWRAFPGRTMHVTGASAARPADVTDVQVRTADGTTVLDLDGR